MAQLELGESQWARLKSFAARGELILFTGAGFSLAGRTREGASLPTVAALRSRLWGLCFPSEPLDEQASLGELYDIALRRKSKDLPRELERSLSVDPATLPPFYERYFAFPWFRIYTLNMDDLAHACSVRFKLPRQLRAVSAVHDKSINDRQDRDPTALCVVHLNGALGLGGPESLTFSERQYAQRIANREPWYVRCVADLMARCVVFVGTELRESPFWQHMELRRREVGRGGREMRPTSLLVSPELGSARRELLEDLRIEWVPGTAEQFANDVLAQLGESAAEGLLTLTRGPQAGSASGVQLVSTLAGERPNLDTEYLLGAEPQWSDLISGRAIERSDDAALLTKARAILEGTEQGVLAVTGTEGAGKSTALMRLALRLSGEGIPVLWLDEDSTSSPAAVHERIRQLPRPAVLAIDDGDLWGRMLASLACDFFGETRFLFVFAARAMRMDSIAAYMSSARVPMVEHVVPNLTDDDIDRLIEALDRANRLGVLKGMSDGQRQRVFRSLAGRQLLVAMIEATSGQRFEDKVANEARELTEADGYVYALVCLTTQERHFLTKDEVMLAAADEQAAAQAALQSLTARHLVVAPPPTYRYRARHRVIAELAVESLAREGRLEDVFCGLAYALACKVEPALDRRDRVWRLLARTINHEKLVRILGVAPARKVYEEVESLLNFDYHYWLQRGSLEVESGDLREAENFLGQARSLAPEDYRVQTEYAYLLLSKACSNPSGRNAAGDVETAISLLDGVIAARGAVDPYPYHVYGSQGLSWSRRAPMTHANRRVFLDQVMGVVQRGLSKHPRRMELQQLHNDLRRETLLMVARDEPEVPQQR